MQRVRAQPSRRRIINITTRPSLSSRVKLSAESQWSYDGAVCRPSAVRADGDSFAACSRVRRPASECRRDDIDDAGDEDCGDRRRRRPSRRHAAARDPPAYSEFGGDRGAIGIAARCQLRRRRSPSNPRRVPRRRPRSQPRAAMVTVEPRLPARRGQHVGRRVDVVGERPRDLQIPDDPGREGYRRLFLPEKRQRGKLEQSRRSRPLEISDTIGVSNHFDSCLFI